MAGSRPTATEWSSDVMALAWLVRSTAQGLELIKMALSPLWIKIAQSCGLAIVVFLISYLCLLTIKYDV